MDSIAYIYRRMIPDYWFEVEENPESYEECDQYLDGKIKSIPEGKSFIFFADPHYFKGETRPLTPINAMNSPAIIGYIRAMTGIKTVINGGDNVERGTGKYNGLQEHLILTNIMKSVAGENYLVVPGNHDLNAVSIKPESGDVDKYRISYVETEKKQYAHIKRVCEDEKVEKKLCELGIFGEAKKEFLAYSRLHYYVDDDDLGMRYIILDTGNQGEGRNGVVEELFQVNNDQELILQYDWLYETLMSTPENYDVAVCAHALLGYGNNKDIPGVVLGVCKILSGYRTKTKITLENPSPHKEKLATYYALGEHEYDFTKRRGSGNAVVVAADKHLDIQRKADYDENGQFVSMPYDGEKLSDTAIVVSSVQTDCIGTNFLNIPTRTPWLMKKGTKSEHCFDVVTICPDGNVKFTRIGAGLDRKIVVK